jgi:hypothetical protein
MVVERLMAEIDRIAKLCFKISHRSLGSGRGRARFPDLAPPIHMVGDEETPTQARS